jgi:hypothetical protein
MTGLSSSPYVEPHNLNPNPNTPTSPPRPQPRPLHPKAAALLEFEPVHLALNMGLREEVLVEKCMGRRLCSKCGKNWNVADIYLKAEVGLMCLYGGVMGWSLLTATALLGPL